MIFNTRLILIFLPCMHVKISRPWPMLHASWNDQTIKNKPKERWVYIAFRPSSFEAAAVLWVQTRVQMRLRRRNQRKELFLAIRWQAMHILVLLTCIYTWAFQSSSFNHRRPLCNTESMISIKNTINQVVSRLYYNFISFIPSFVSLFYTLILLFFTLILLVHT